eukprot:CAMPEP_0115020204 /NCGR_PEP_ID=MMETSP0216-20121206/29946_1 /TAXON_ID=223996 /ORGANISM="Protocruzia adherens, Strain Boccale" /LENGTH=183 /DNA_ID=CAMNT_0002391913 /DNA_START=1725 /DNA_END=2273 /DNA_ORIENTATION=+
MSTKVIPIIEEEVEGTSSRDTAKNNTLLRRDSSENELIFSLRRRINPKLEPLQIPVNNLLATTSESDGTSELSDDIFMNRASPFFKKESPRAYGDDDSLMSPVSTNASSVGPMFQFRQESSSIRLSTKVLQNDLIETATGDLPTPKLKHKPSDWGEITKNSTTDPFFAETTIRVIFRFVMTLF